MIELENDLIAIEILENDSKDPHKKTDSGLFVSNATDVKTHRKAKILLVSDSFQDKEFLQRAKVGREIAIPMQGREKGPYKNVRGLGNFYMIPKSDILFYL